MEPEMTLADYGPEAVAYYEHLKDVGDVTLPELIRLDVGNYFRPGWDDEMKELFAEDAMMKSVRCGLADYRAEKGTFRWFLKEV